LIPAAQKATVEQFSGNRVTARVKKKAEKVGTQPQAAQPTEQPPIPFPFDAPFRQLNVAQYQAESVALGLNMTEHEKVEVMNALIDRVKDDYTEADKHALGVPTLFGFALLKAANEVIDNPPENLKHLPWIVYVYAGFFWQVKNLFEAIKSPTRNLQFEVETACAALWMFAQAQGAKARIAGALAGGELKAEAMIALDRFKKQTIKNSENLARNRPLGTKKVQENAGARFKFVERIFLNEKNSNPYGSDKDHYTFTAVKLNELNSNDDTKTAHTKPAKGEAYTEASVRGIVTRGRKPIGNTHRLKK
jgi:hypothetical protein